MKPASSRGKSLVTEHVYAQPPDAVETGARVKAGLPVKEFDALRDVLGLTIESLAKKLGISAATLSRRRRSGEALDAPHGDRVVRFARLFRLALDLYDGDTVAARSWLMKPARALDGQAPLDLAETESGAREVENLIGRLEHGVYT